MYLKVSTHYESKRPGLSEAQDAYYRPNGETVWGRKSACSEAISTLVYGLLRHSFDSHQLSRE